MRFRPLPILTLCAIPALAVLLWLGQWQWSRYQEKLALEAAPLAPFEQVTLYVAGADTASLNVSSLYDGQAGWRRYVAVGETPGAPPEALLLYDVILSVEAAPIAPPAGMALALPVRPTTHVPKRSAFTPADNPAERRFHVLDPAAMLTAAGGQPGAGAVTVYEPETIPVIDLDGRLAIAQPTPLDTDLDPRLDPDLYSASTGARTVLRANPYAAPGLAGDLPPVRHLGYAITWWGLALALIGVYVGLHAARGRFSPPGK